MTRSRPGPDGGFAGGALRSEGSSTAPAGAQELPPTAVRILSAGMALQAGALAWLAIGPGTSLDGYLFVGRGWSEGAARTADLVLATAATLAGVTVLVAAVRRGEGGAPWRWLAAPLSAAAFGLVALTSTLAGGHPFAAWTLPAWATRWLAPLALVRAPDRLLRTAVALTFAQHGLEALGRHPLFIDLVLGTLRTLQAPLPSEAAVQQGLLLVGVLDLVVAAGLLLRRWTGLALWAMLWGIATALSRPVALGPEFAFEATLRAMNVCAPAALWLFWRHRTAPDALPTRARTTWRF